MTLTVPILIASSTPNLNNRVYSKEILQQITDYINENDRRNYGMIGYKDPYDPLDDVKTINLKEVSHLVRNPVITNNILSVEIEILETESGRLLKGMIDRCVFRPSGIGNVDKDTGEITNYSFISINAVSKENDSFKNLL